MNKIKTRETKRNIKSFDKARDVSEHMRDAFIRTKDTTKNLSDDGQVSPSEYAEDQIKYTAEDALSASERAVEKGTKKAVNKGKEKYQKHKAKKLEKEFSNATPDDASVSKAKKEYAKKKSSTPNGKIPTKDSIKRTVKQTKKSTEKATIKTSKSTLKSSQKAVKTTEKTTKAAIKTAEKTAKATKEAAKASAKAAVTTAKAVAKATVAAIKAIIAGTKALIAAIAAGGWVAVVIIIVICLVALIVGSCFGIFFSSEDTGTGMTMQTVVQEINTEYQTKIEDIKRANTYDVLEMSGSRAVWKDVLAVYSVKVTGDENNPDEVATMNDSKKATLKEIFWDMNSISSKTESKTETIITETDDGNGNIVETSEQKTSTYLYITVSHKTVEEMSNKYGFSTEQRDQLTELLAEKNNMQWSAVLYGITSSSSDIVSVAMSQLGNIGGQPYWSWYGFSSRIEWCCCFVSWCAEQCGYIDAGVISKFASCSRGVQWFKDRGLWRDKSFESTPGTIIFFDWDNKGSSGPQDGIPDHVGIVKKIENGSIYTIEGNFDDSCKEHQYEVGYYEIFGYGVVYP